MVSGSLKHFNFLFILLLAENCLMQRAAQAGNEAAALFLATHGAKVNHVNKWVCLSIWSYDSHTTTT